MSGTTSGDARRAAAAVRALRPLLLAACLAGGVAHAADDGPPATIVLSGQLTERNPFLGGSGRTRFPVTVYLRGDALRVDFPGRPGERGRMLYDAKSEKGWLIDIGGKRALQIEAPAMRSLAALVVDPDDPCARFLRRCEAAPVRHLAGGPRKGYRFRGAAGRGPGGLSDGEFWIDAEHGVIVSYRATGLRRGQEPAAFEASLVTRDLLPDDFFALPDVETPQLPDKRSRK